MVYTRSVTLPPSATFEYIKEILLNSGLKFVSMADYAAKRVVLTVTGPAAAIMELFAKVLA